MLVKALSQPRRVACLSKAAAQTGLSPPIPDLKVSADSDDLQAVPMHHGRDGFTTPGPPGHQVPVIALSSFYRYAMAEDVHIKAVQTVTRPRVDTDHSSMQVEVLATYAVLQLRPTTRR